MDNIFSYNLNNIDSGYDGDVDNDIKEYKLKTMNSKIKKKYNIKKYIGKSYDGDIYELNDKLASKKRIKKLICKRLKMDKIKTTDLEQYCKILNKLRANRESKQYMNEIIDYFNDKNNMYLIYPYYIGYNLNQLKDNLWKLNASEYNIIVKHIIKKILSAIIAVHKTGVAHNNLNEEKIMINTNNKNLKLIFLDWNISSLNNVNNENNELFYDDINKCGKICIDLLTHKYNIELNNTENTENTENLGNILSNAFKFLNFNKKKTIDDLMDSDLKFYLNTIKENMIENPTLDISNVLKELLFNEKYGENNNNNNNE